MDRDQVTEILASMQAKYEEALEEITERFNENMQWLSDICTEITKYTSQSSVLLPKIPAVERKVRWQPFLKKVRMILHVPRKMCSASAPRLIPGSDPS
jgi:hypothetical protein